MQTVHDHTSAETAHTPPVRQASGPLAGMRVLELAQIMAGPTCGMLLADMGADVIKIEKLPGGDDSRNYREPRIRGVSAPYLVMNRNKRGMALNLKSDAGKAVLLRMVESADVLIENYRHDTLAKMGLGYEALKVVNPGLIYTAISGYGRTGPYAEKPGFDLIAQGFAGLMSITGEPNRAPVKTGNSVADICAGILAATGVSAAYSHKLKTGEGQQVETSLMEAALHQTFWQASSYFATGESPGPTGSAHLLSAPYQAFKTLDGWINIGGANQSNWERIVGVLGQPQWLQDPRFDTNTARMQHANVLAEEIGAELILKDCAYWLHVFDAAGVPAGPVHTIGQALSHPQTLARDMVVEVDHPTLGAMKTLGCPIHFSATPTQIDRAAPDLGQHTTEILLSYGYTEADVQHMYEQGSIA
jgi:crotonobetainyl-CoA:carnitine CoA-transferase CaiB-like acyl-CoA transferase